MMHRKLRWGELDSPARSLESERIKAAGTRAHPAEETAMLMSNSPQATSLRSIKALVPLLDRVLVQRVKAEAKTASGIFLPESTVKELNEAKVLAVGPGALDRDGKRVPMGVNAGDKVLIPQVCTLIDWALGYLEGYDGLGADRDISTVVRPLRLARRSTTSSGTASKFLLRTIIRV
jgi:chaperonin GroES